MQAASSPDPGGRPSSATHRITYENDGNLATPHETSSQVYCIHMPAPRVIITVAVPEPQHRHVLPSAVPTRMAACAAADAPQYPRSRLRVDSQQPSFCESARARIIWLLSRALRKISRRAPCIPRYSRKTQSGRVPSSFFHGSGPHVHRLWGSRPARFGRPWIAACLTITIRSIFRGPGREGSGSSASCLGLAPPVQCMQEESIVLIGA
jgi:hypothetical protein